MSNQNRKLVLQHLINFSDTTDNIKSQLRKFPWDCEEPVISMSMKDMASVLIKCQQGLITVDELEKWADLIESREDIEFLESDSKKIKAIINILANPEINGKVSSSMIQKWLNDQL